MLLRGHLHTRPSTVGVTGCCPSGGAFQEGFLKDTGAKTAGFRHTIKLKPSLIKIRIILSYESCKAALVELKNKNKGNEQNRSPFDNVVVVR